MGFLTFTVSIFLFSHVARSLVLFHHRLYQQKLTLSSLSVRTSFSFIRAHEQTGNDETNFVWDPKLFPKLDPLEDYYRVLEVSPTVSEAALKRSFYKLVIKYHPDNKSSKADKDLANRQMMVINNAYKVLKDPIKRSKYDRSRYNGKAASIDPYSSSTTSDSNSYQPSSRARSTFSADIDQISVSFEEFKRFLEDIYEKSFPHDSTFVQDLYHRFETDKEFRENIIRNGDFKSSRATQSHVDQSKSEFRDSASFISHNNEEMFSRGDGSIASLKTYLQSLKRRKIRKEEALRADRRDWGEVTDENLIRSRLHAIDELRDLGQEIEHLQDEILSMEFRDCDGKQRYSEECEYWKHKQERDEQQYRSYRETHEKRVSDIEQSQPQPHRISEEKKKVGFWGDDGDYGPRWKEDQRKRRQGW